MHMYRILVIQQQTDTAHAWIADELCIGGETASGFRDKTINEEGDGPGGDSS